MTKHLVEIRQRLGLNLEKPLNIQLDNAISEAKEVNDHGKKNPDLNLAVFSSCGCGHRRPPANASC
jgi:hypothetical protein